MSTAKLGHRDRKGRLRPAVHNDHRLPHKLSIATRAAKMATDGIDARHAADPLAGSSLGRLLLRGRARRPDGINQQQYDAGIAYLSLCIRAWPLLGIPNPNPRSPVMARQSHGVDLSELPAATVERIRKTYQRADMELGEACKLYGGDVRTILSGVVFMDWPLSWLRADGHELLRHGLDAVGRATR